MAKKDQNVKYKKAPQAPRRFKSAYMFYSTEKHKSIRREEKDGDKLQTTEVAKMVSQAWKDLPPDEREAFEEMARRDKARYEMEKSMYTGPWKVPAKKRSQKDPSAPKRPMSAFLSFSNSKRAIVKAKYPTIGNAEISRKLAQMWKDAPPSERNKHIEKEYHLRQEYKTAMVEWRKNADEELQAERQQREEVVLRALDTQEQRGGYQSGGGDEALSPENVPAVARRPQSPDQEDDSGDGKHPHPHPPTSGGYAAYPYGYPPPPYHHPYYAMPSRTTGSYEESAATGGGGAEGSTSSPPRYYYPPPPAQGTTSPEGYPAAAGYPYGYPPPPEGHEQGYEGHPPAQPYGYYGSYYPPPTQQQQEHMAAWHQHYYGSPPSGPPPPYGAPPGYNYGGYQNEDNNT